MTTKNVITSLVTLLTCLALNAQIKKCDNPLKIDFTNLQSEYKYYVPNKNSQTIKIININRKLYSIEEAKEEKDFNTTIPAALSSIKLPSFINLRPLPPLGAQIEAAYLPADAQANPEEKILEYFAEIKRRAEKLNDATLLYNQVNNLSKDCKKKPEEIRNEMNGFVKEFLGDSKPGDTVPAKLHERFRDSLLDMRLGAEVILEKLKATLPAYLKQRKKNLDKVIGTADEQIGRNDAIIKNRKSTKAQLTTARTEIAEFQKLKKQTQEELADLKETGDDMTESLDEAKGLVKDMFAFEKDDNIHSIMNLVHLVTSDNFFSYTATLKKAKKDKTTYNFSITPKDINECTTADKQVVEVELYTKGGVKIDFSTGVFINTGNEDFLEKTYYYKNITDSTRQIVSARRSNRLMLSLGALMHIYCRRPGKVKVGGSLGSSVTADFTTVNFHAGPSLIFGTENRFILTAGVTLKSSKVLDRDLEINKTYTTLQSPDEIPTVNTFPKFGAFLALTYNFTRFGKE